MTIAKKPTNTAINAQIPVVLPVAKDKKVPDKAEEFGGATGPEPTRFGDWENKGRCTDF